MMLGEYKALAGVRANFILGANGEHVGHSGSSRDLSNAQDKELLIHLRALADVILVDAVTARAEKYGQSRHAPIVVISASGDFDDLSPEDTDFVYLHQSLSSRTIDTMRSNFGEHLLLECGPTLLNIAIKLGLIDELCLTVTGDVARAVSMSELDLDSLKMTVELVSGDSHFTRWQRS